MDIDIREAKEDDARQICDVFQATYGEHYAYRQFFDPHLVKKMIFSDDAHTLIAEDRTTGRIEGTASVILEIGAYSDLVGEFGRLAVRPDARGHHIGSRLMKQRLRFVEHGRLHVALSETRVTHPYSMRIGWHHGFAPLGFLPLKLQLEWRESAALMIRYFGNALALRRNNPRIVPEVYPLAALALRNAGLPVDAIVDDEASSYPYDDAYQLEELTLEGYANLLRIERGRVSNREIFGPGRLSYGFFKLQARHSKYLIARRGSHLVGAVGFTLDRQDNKVRVFELISLDDGVIRFLLAELERHCREVWEVAYAEIDVSAYAPRMQRTLIELGFVAAAYVPALTFHHVERLDLIKMVRLFVPLDLGPTALLPEVQEVADLVLSAFANRTVLPRIECALDHMTLFRGLTEDQRHSVAALCGVRSVEEGEAIFTEGDPSDAIHILLDGSVEVHFGDTPLAEITVEKGECLGEMSLLSAQPHRATARAATPVLVAVLPHTDLEGLLRRRPIIGTRLYRNLAADLAGKLRRSDETLLARQPARPSGAGERTWPPLEVPEATMKSGAAR